MSTIESKIIRKIKKWEDIFVPFNLEFDIFIKRNIGLQFMHSIFFKTK